MTQMGGLGGTKRVHPEVCPAPECDKPTGDGHPYCSMHLWRLKRHGRLEGRTPLDRMVEKIQRGPADCWQWTGSRSKGYGIVRINGLRQPAHRAMYELLVASVPEHLHLDHLCRNRACVNPDHLEPVSPWENSLRGYNPVVVAHRTDTCKRGHDLTLATVHTRGDGSTFRQCRACRRITAAARKAAT